jgi:hypothetical protein
MRRNRSGPVIFGLLLLCGAARAQTGFNLTEVQVANQQALRGYRWTSRSEVKVEDKVRLSSLSMARMDDKGRVQMEQIGGQDSGAPSQVFQSGRSQAQIRQDKLDERILYVTGQLRKYDAPSKKQLDTFREKATRNSGIGDLADTEQMTLQGLIKPDDRVTLWVDRKTGLQRRMEVATTGGKEPFVAVTTFAPVHDGAWVVSRRTIEVPRLKVQIVTENTDHLAPLTPAPETKE